MAKYALIVENEHIHFNIFKEALVESGFEILLLPNGSHCASYEEAMTIINSEQQIDLLMLDIELNGDKTGIDIAREARQLGRLAKIIITTSHTKTTKYARQIKELGNIAIITKPQEKLEKDSIIFEILALMPVAIVGIEGIIVKDFTKEIKGFRNDDKVAHQVEISKDDIVLILAGNTGIENIFVPKDYILILTKSKKISYLIRTSIKSFITDYRLGDYIYKLNGHIAANLNYFMRRTNNKKTFSLVFGTHPNQYEIKITKTFKDELVAKLSSLGKKL
jgi:CheY-like chemotaxis protein